MKLLTQNTKTLKAEKLVFADSKGNPVKYTNWILQLRPHQLNYKRKQLCPYSQECASTCLEGSGYGKFENVIKARQEKTDLFVQDPEAFVDLLIKEIKRHTKRLEKKDSEIPIKLVVRLNGFSDIPWENLKVEGKNIFEHCPDVQFLDYTKWPSRTKLNIPNYDLTFSATDLTWSHALDYLSVGGRVAMVFETLPPTFRGYPVINGDLHDLRFLDPGGVIVGLVYKSVRDNANSLKSSSIIVKG